MSTSTGSANALSRSTATTQKHYLCNPTTQTESDWVFDYYDSKKTGSVKLDQVKAAIGNANDYLSQELINKMEIDHVDTNGLLCDGLSPERNNSGYTYLGAFDDVAAC